MKNADIIRAVKRAARDRYAWPGGYPLIVIMRDGETLCTRCAHSEFGLIGRATRDGTRDGWAAAGVDVHWEGPPETCAHCNTEIESAYGDSSDQAIFTRAEYMATAADREASSIAHRRYYAQFVNARTIARVVKLIGADTLRASTDPHLNDIPLRRWDGLSLRLPLACTFKSRGDFATLGGLVYVAKEAARQWIEANKEPTP